MALEIAWKAQVRLCSRYHSVGHESRQQLHMLPGGGYSQPHCGIRFVERALKCIDELQMKSEHRAVMGCDATVQGLAQCAGLFAGVTLSQCGEPYRNVPSAREAALRYLRTMIADICTFSVLSGDK